MNPHELLARLERHARTPLAHLPTPLRPVPRLVAALASDAPDILVKHDDLTGFGLGGNKVRKLEHELAPERLAEVTHLVTTGGPQSNHCRVTAAAAARLGLECILIVNGEPGDPPKGNALLHRRLGADVRVVGGREEREAAMTGAADEVERGGGRALIVPLGASTSVGALGYVRAAAELQLQLQDLPEPHRPVRVFLASSSAGTLAGLVAGFTLLDGLRVRLMGVSADVPEAELVQRALELAKKTLELLGAPEMQPPPSLLAATDREVGDGYGMPTAASREATSLFARSEGILLDPVYTGKAGAGLVRAIREGQVEPDERVVFLHTGGHPALFA